MSKPLPLSLAQFEDGVPVFSEVALSPLIDAFFALKATMPSLDFSADSKVVLGQVLQNPAALKLLIPLISTIGQAGKSHVIRRISAIVNAADDDLIQAERDPEKLQAMEDLAAKRSYLEGAEDVLRFFSRLGLTASVSAISSTETQKSETQGETNLAENGAVTPSGGS